MKTKFSRAQILDLFGKKIKAKEPIFVANASAGIIAKYSEKNSADMISVHSWGRFRYRGHPVPLSTLWWSGSNEMKDNVFDVAHEMTNALDNVPLVGGLEAYDALFRHTDELLDKAMDFGYDGIQNFPTHGGYIPMRWLRDAAGFGFKREMEMIKLANEKDIFSMAYAFWTDDAKEFAENGADVIIAHAGWTTGGTTGSPKPGSVEFDWDGEGFAYQPKDVKGTIKVANDIAAAARKVNPKQIVLITGGSLNSPENCQEIMDGCDVDGFELGHAIDVMPIEEELIRIGKEYKSLKLHPDNPNYRPSAL